ncbi:MRG-domain-containing protein [Sesbania bispinosa]|nr:MRG-domain-containing protein [Sesbania bispinosa]
MQLMSQTAENTIAGGAEVADGRGTILQCRSGSAREDGTVGGTAGRDDDGVVAGRNERDNFAAG